MSENQPADDTSLAKSLDNEAVSRSMKKKAKTIAQSKKSSSISPPSVCSGHRLCRKRKSPGNSIRKSTVGDTPEYDGGESYTNEDDEFLHGVVDSDGERECIDGTESRSSSLKRTTKRRIKKRKSKSPDNESDGGADDVPESRPTCPSCDKVFTNISGLKYHVSEWLLRCLFLIFKSYVVYCPNLEVDFPWNK